MVNNDYMRENAKLYVFKSDKGNPRSAWLNHYNRSMANNDYLVENAKLFNFKDVNQRAIWFQLDFNYDNNRTRSMVNNDYFRENAKLFVFKSDSGNPRSAWLHHYNRSMAYNDYLVENAKLFNFKDVNQKAIWLQLDYNCDNN